MGKQYAILRVQKCKGAEIGAMQYHNDREPGKHTNQDIDQSRTRLNREMCPHADYEGEVQARIDAGYRGTRKVRKDAVKLVEGIVTASPEFFEGASAEEVRDFFEDALGFCREEFGESNLVHFTVHMDEESELHFITVKRFLFEAVYKNPVAKGEEGKARDIVLYQFAYYVANTHKLPDFYPSIAEEETPARAAAHFISGMSDRYCDDLYEGMVIPRSWPLL